MVSNLVLINWVMYLLTKVHGGHFLFEEPVEHENMLVINSISPVASFEVWPLPWSVIREHHKMHRLRPNDPSVELKILQRHALKVLKEMPWEGGLEIPAVLHMQSQEADEASK